MPYRSPCRSTCIRIIRVDYIDESEVLTPADEVYHLNKRDYTVPFVCGCRDIGEAARRIAIYASYKR